MKLIRKGLYFCFIKAVYMSKYRGMSYSSLDIILGSNMHIVNHLSSAIRTVSIILRCLLSSVF